MFKATATVRAVFVPLLKSTLYQDDGQVIVRAKVGDIRFFAQVCARKRIISIVYVANQEFAACCERTLALVGEYGE